jgi:ATP-dependent Clp protease ATP-binding subunit ClpA
MATTHWLKSKSAFDAPADIQKLPGRPTPSYYGRPDLPSISGRLHRDTMMVALFERFTEKARRVIFFGRYAAVQHGSTQIEPEHPLLGLIREDRPLAVMLLKSSETVEQVRKELEEWMPRGQNPSMSADLPFSHPSKRVLAYTAEECERLRHRHIRTAHMVLGLLREESWAAQLLRTRGIRIDDVREMCRAPEEPTTDRLRYSRAAQAVNYLACYEATPRGGFRIETEYLLLAILSDDPGLSARLLASEEVAATLIKKIDSVRPMTSAADGGDLWETEDVIQARARAEQEALKTGSPLIAPAHLIHGFVQLPDCLIVGT